MHLPGLIAAIAFSSLFSLQAREITPQEALQAYSTHSPKRAAGVSQELKLSYTTQTDNRNTAYVFSDQNQGFVVLAADDAVTPVIGFGNKLDLEDGQIPDNMKAFLDIIGREIIYASNHYVSEPTPEPTRKYIAPMLTTKWNQDKPYNNDCPRIDDQATYTGCVATAMAQLMKFHRYPAKGTGSHSYNPRSNEEVTYSVDFSSTTYDWNNMIDSYYGKYTDDQAKAVSTLMYQAGIAANMDYGTSSSGAYVSEAAAGMADFFGYDRGMYFAERDCYTLPEWNNLIYSEIAAKRPVMLAGGSHAFICDGYDGDNYFHINWGWGGAYDGNFLLTMLTPQSSGIGGYSSNYSDNLEALINLQPNIGTESYPAKMTMYGDFKSDANTYARRSTVSVKFGGANTAMYYNTSIGSLNDLSMVLKLENTTNPDDVKYISVSMKNELRANYGFSSYSFKSTLFPVGTWKVTQYFKVGEGDPIKISTLNGHIDQLTFKVTNTQITVSGNDAEVVKFSVGSLQAQSKIYSGMKARFTAQASNEGVSEYSGDINLVLKNSDGDVYSSPAMRTTLQAGEQRELEFICGFTDETGKTAAPAGSYTLYLNDKDKDELLSDGLSVTVNSKPLTSAKLTPTRLVIHDITSGGGTDSEPYVINSDGEVTFEAEFRCSLGAFYDKAYVILTQVADDGSITEVGKLYSPFQTLETLKSASFTVTGNIPNPQPDNLYRAQFGAPVTLWAQKQFSFRFTDTYTSVAVTEQEAEEPVYFDLAGRQVANPAHGVFIKKVSGKVSKVIL